MEIREKNSKKAIKGLYLFVFAYISFIVVKMALLSNGAEIISYLCGIINFESLLNIIVFNSVSGAYYACFLIALLYCYLMCIIFNNNINKFEYVLIPIVLAIHIFIWRVVFIVRRQRCFKDVHKKLLADGNALFLNRTYAESL